jgi:DnaJ homolog subfamily A member 2
MFGGDMDDMMSAFFGGGGMPGMMGGGGGRRQRTGRDVGRALPVSLEDLYQGKTIDVPREKQVLCGQCKGRGVKPGSQGGPCMTCRGRGARVVMQPIGPGMVQQVQVRCDACKGQGEIVNDKDRCKGCEGNKVKQEDSTLKVYIERGMEHEQHIPFPGEGDQSPDIDVPGDIVMVLQQLKHDVFTRDGNDLHMKQKLTLAEALCGFQFVINHLDGRLLVVRNEPGQIIKPNDVKCIINEGMPEWKEANSFGNLIVTFEIVFPETMQQSQIDLLRTALPPPAQLDVDYNAEEAEECYLSREALDSVRKEMERQAEDEEEEGGGGGGMQCAHQ